MGSFEGAPPGFLDCKPEVFLAGNLETDASPWALEGTPGTFLTGGPFEGNFPGALAGSEPPALKGVDTLDGALEGSFLLPGDDGFFKLKAQVP